VRKVSNNNIPAYYSCEWYTVNHSLLWLVKWSAVRMDWLKLKYCCGGGVRSFGDVSRGVAWALCFNNYILQEYLWWPFPSTQCHFPMSPRGIGNGANVRHTSSVIGASSLQPVFTTSQVRLLPSPQSQLFWVGGGSPPLSYYHIGINRRNRASIRCVVCQLWDDESNGGAIWKK